MSVYIYIEYLPIDLSSIIVFFALSLSASVSLPFSRSLREPPISDPSARKHAILGDSCSQACAAVADAARLFKVRFQDSWLRV